MARDNSTVIDLRPSCHSSMASRSTALPSISNASSDHCRVLLQGIVKNPSQSDQIVKLKGDDAQDIADLLIALLHEDDAFTSEEGRQFFGLLKSLVKSSEVLPQCYQLRDLRCDFGLVREGGSFADIFEGEYRERKVCVRAVRLFQKEDNSRMLKAMAKEAVLWAHLSHGNILPFYGVYIQPKSRRICLISPWMDRGDLSAHLSKCPDTPRFPLVRDIVAGLRYLHTLGIVHGDLKAKNVLMSDKGHALIANFGISHFIVSITSTRLSDDSARWMAPELHAGRSPTLRSDMWSFGCVCYEVLTCKLPFCDLTTDYQVLSTLNKEVTRQPGDVDQFEGFSYQGRKLVNRCWDHDPDSRPSCEEIYNSVVDQAEERIDLVVQDVAPWKDVRGRSRMIVNYAHAHNILLDIRGTHEGPYDSTSPLCPIPTTPNLPLNSNYTSPVSHPGLPPQPGIGVNPSPDKSHSTYEHNVSLVPYGADISHTIGNIKKDDIIIAFMGPTGTGKSYFIDLLTGQKGKRAGNSLKTVTNQIEATRVKHQGYDDRIVLIDTPGFDNATRSDMETLQIISDWLQKTYSKQIKLSGLIYLHRITDNRMAGSPHKNLRMFGELCGDVAMNRVRLVSTMWGKVKSEVGEGRERELRDNFWRHFIDKGSKIERLKENKGEEAWRIVEGLIHDSKEREAVLLQEELVELEKQLHETAAGKTLYTSLQNHLADSMETLKMLLAQVENDPSLTKELKKEYARINDQFQRTFQEVTKLKIPLGKRILLFFFGKKARAKAIKVSEA